MTIIKTLFIAGILAVFCAGANCQSFKSELGLHLGISNYQGDVIPSHFYTFTDNQVAYGVYAKRYFSSVVGMRLSYNRLAIQGDDFDVDVRSERLAQFESEIHEIGLRFDLEFPNENQKGFFRTGLTPYAFVGGAYSLFNHNTQYGLYADGSESSQWVLADQQADESSTLALQLGIGIKNQFKRGWTLGLEIGYRPTYTDLLDGISATGNPENDDSYMMANLVVGKRLGTVHDRDNDGVSDSKDSCPDLAGVKELDGCPDADSDGVADPMDMCPGLAGSLRTQGCPDGDGDGIKDSEDKCPNAAGPSTTNGCPDSDNDGIVDRDDKCPNTKGSKAFEGCPDTDGDGVADNDDACPNEVGPIGNGGCPIVKEDSDNDGVPDEQDLCPNQPGVLSNNGCPDTDGDGLIDKDDRCPDMAGPRESQGCPDSDNDGVVDIDDKCPDEVGIASNSGCPEIKVEDKKILDLAVESVNFKTGSTELTTSSFAVLDQIVDLLQRYPAYDIYIDGHTDNVGSEQRNLELSAARASSCKTYISSKGIDVSRIHVSGYGESRPITTNATKDGRAINRRVEFDLRIRD